MTNKLQRLELTWPGKDERFNPEPRILLEDKEKSYGDAESGNMLIHGDNLLALKALEQDYAGKVKCIYIDPPYNTGNAFEHYDDGLEHSIWLSLMRDRLEILKRLLSNDGGSIWISIDADESHYLKVLCDEVFGRQCFVDEVIWQRAFAPVNLKKTLSRSHDTILVYCKNPINFILNTLPRSDKQCDNYKNPDNDIRGAWTSADCTVGPVVEDKLYEIITPNGRSVYPPEGRCWLFTQERFNEMVADNRIWFGKEGNNAPRVKKFLSEVKGGVVSTTLWTRDECGDNQEAKREIKALFPNEKNPFDTPKPERLIQRVLTLGSNPGDLVLDSFLGSGTTAAVAHKMGRRWIGVEMEDTAYTYCQPRLQKVISGEDQGGITKAVNWQGGGGFKFYELASSLIVKDKYGQQIISEKYNADTVIASRLVYLMYSKTSLRNVRCKTHFNRSLSSLCRRSEYPHFAPVGYINQRTDRHTTTIVEDPIMGPIVRKIFRDYATGLYSLADITKMANDLGFMTVRKTQAHKQTIINLLNNPFYYGYMRCYNNLYRHKYECLITKKQFDACQTILHQKSAPKKRKIIDVYRGLIHCKNCGRLITPDPKTNRYGKQYTYLLCPHCKGTCINENIADKQVQDDLSRLKKIPEKWLNKVLEKINEDIKQEHKLEIEQQRVLKSRLTQLMNKRDALLDMRLENSITQEQYNKKLDTIMKEKEDIEERLYNYSKLTFNGLSSLKDLIHLISNIPDIYKNSNYDEKRKILKLLYSNLFLEGKNCLFSIRKPLEILLSRGHHQIWSGLLDSNQRHLAPKASALPG